eukprot:gene7841-biopygen19591
MAAPQAPLGSKMKKLQRRRRCQEQEHANPPRSVMLCPVLICPVLFCAVMLCSVLFGSVPFCSVLSCPFYPVMSCPSLPTPTKPTQTNITTPQCTTATQWVRVAEASCHVSKQPPPPRRSGGGGRRGACAGTIKMVVGEDGCRRRWLWAKMVVGED